jgi:hypothetical protein
VDGDRPHGNVHPMVGAHMREVMPSNPNNSPVSMGLEEVFHVDWRWMWFNSLIKSPRKTDPGGR